jgi:hypothetical protein
MITNLGEKSILGLARDNPNVPADGIRVVNTDIFEIDYGVIINRGDFIIDDSNDDGLVNDDYITSEDGGRMLIDAYDRLQS